MWKDGNKSTAIKVPDGEQVKSFIINSDMPDFNMFDNYFPSVADRYKKLDLDKEVLGVYEIIEFDYDAIITEKEGLFYLKGWNSDWSGYLLPIDKNNFITIDGRMEISFKKEEGKIAGIIINVKSQGFIDTGQKQE